MDGSALVKGKGRTQLYVIYLLRPQIQGCTYKLFDLNR